jgi:lipopolysaccharide/colanic/teichoic acid biosynthesis glycosyltransferase
MPRAGDARLALNPVTHHDSQREKRRPFILELLNKKENGAIAAFTETIERRDDHLHSSGGARQIRQGGITPARYFRWKGPFDRAAAAALLVPGLPLIALLVALVRLTSKGPGIYRQARVGKDGRRFMMYKIRTMRHDAEAGTGAVWTQTQDPRVTAVGKVFRKLHLDELPQLFNVLRGEMSLVGPRPERPEFVRVLAEAVPGYRNRLAVRPGITGLAQINLPPDTDIISVQRKLLLDCEYVERGGMWLDTRLMICTFLRLFKVPEGWLQYLLALRRDAKIPGLAEAALAASEADVESSQATPASILLQIGNLPDSVEPLDNSGSTEHRPLGGNGAADRLRRGRLRSRRSDRDKPR